jgi:hypothetical protein
MGKGKVHYIEVVSDEEDDMVMMKVLDRNSGEPVTGYRAGTIAGYPQGSDHFHTFQESLNITPLGQRHCAGKRVTTLVDGGATHNFIDVALVTKRKIHVQRILRDSMW